MAEQAAAKRRVVDDNEPPAQRRKTATQELVDLTASTKAEPPFQDITCIANISNLRKLLKSLRPSSSATKPVYMCVRRECPIVAKSQFGAGVFPINQQESLQDWLTKNQSGIVVMAMSEEESTFSCWFIPAEVGDGLQIGQEFECWVSPRALIDKLGSMNLSGKGTMVFKQDSLAIKVTPNKGIATNMVFRYVDDNGDNLAMFMDLYKSANTDTITAQVDAYSLGQILSAMNTDNAAALSSLRLHSMQRQGVDKATVALTFSIETEVWGLFNGYVTETSLDTTTIDFRVEAAERADKAKAKEEKEVLEETEEDILRRADAAMDKGKQAEKQMPVDDALERIQTASMQFLGKMEKDKHLKLGMPMPFEGLHTYVLMMDEQFCSSKMLVLFKDTASDSPHGVTLLLSRDKFPLIMITPLGNGCFGLHLMMYRTEGE